jgi:hypothetical protein
MFAPIRKNAFKFYRSNGSITAFNADSLADYILASGDFCDPISRIPFSDGDLKAIDELRFSQSKSTSSSSSSSSSNSSKTTAGADAGTYSVFAARHNPTMFEDFKFRRDALLGLERCAGDVITDILGLLESFDVEEAQLRLSMREFPLFEDLYNQLRQADPEYARHCMSHWRQFLRGPSNYPTEDFFGLLRLTLSFMDRCERDSEPQFPL